MIKTLFLSVLGISLAASLIILLIVLSAPLLNKRYAAKWKYWIWIVLALRLLVPFGKAESEPPLVIDIPRQMTAGLSTDTQPEQKYVDITFLDFAAVVWLLGGMAMLSVHGFSYVRFKRQVVKNGISIEDASVLCLLQQLAEELQIRRKIAIIKYSRTASPMISGFVHPILVMPDETYCREELYFILKHELLHLKRHDICFKLLLLAVHAVHWFNPVVWLMRKEATVDMELSCDESVVRGMSLEDRKAYTETLMSALYRQYIRRTYLTTQFYGGKQEIKRRFKNILTGTEKKNGLFLVVCTVALTFVSGSMVGYSVKETASVGTVNVDTLRVREEPERDALVIGLLQNGAEVTILAEENGFYRISWQEEDDTAEAYVRKEYVDAD